MREERNVTFFFADNGHTVRNCSLVCERYRFWTFQSFLLLASAMLDSLHRSSILVGFFIVLANHFRVQQRTPSCSVDIVSGGKELCKGTLSGSARPQNIVREFTSPVLISI